MPCYRMHLLLLVHNPFTVTEIKKLNVCLLLVKLCFYTVFLILLKNVHKRNVHVNYKIQTILSDALWSFSVLRLTATKCSFSDSFLIRYYWVADHRLMWAAVRSFFSRESIESVCKIIDPVCDRPRVDHTQIRHERSSLTLEEAGAPDVPPSPHVASSLNGREAGLGLLAFHRAGSAVGNPSPLPVLYSRDIGKIGKPRDWGQYVSAQIPSAVCGLVWTPF